MHRIALLCALMLPAHAGEIKVNFEFYARYCPETDPIPVYELRAHLGTITHHAPITASQHQSLLAVADYVASNWQVSCAPLDAAASSILGAWYTGLATDDRQAFCLWYDELG